MLSECFIKFLMDYDNDNNTVDNNEIEEIEFKSVKVQTAANLVIESIKESF